MLLRLGDKLMIADRMPGGAPGPAYGRSGWGIPSWGGLAPLAMGPMKPEPVGARYFCGDDYPMYEAQEIPCAQGNQYTGTKADYQEKVTEHYHEEHPDLHYPIDQVGLDRMAKMKRKAASILRTQADLKELAKWNKENGVGGGVDLSNEYLRVERPRELPDFTEFDFPDANVADAATEEIELDQLISIAARQGRRFLGYELQSLDLELATEMVTLAADTVLEAAFQLNTRTGNHNLDDPENLVRATLEWALNVTEGSQSDIMFSAHNAPPGGLVYVAPRLFWRFFNNLDRQVDIGDMFVRIATVTQPLSTFLLFELLEQFSGLFGLT
jgi:predicted GIY-YIG superfamily endonuclease